MRMMRLGVAIAGAMAFTSAYAFHSGGVAECGGCHAIHKADATGAIVGATNTNLLNGNTVSETCLGCHAANDTRASSYHVLSTTTGAYAAGVSPVERSPGGDFGWLLKTYTYATRGGGTASWSPGGHRINAPAFGFPAQAGMSPGGNYPAAQLGCSSCHDPHGKARTDASGNFVAQNANKIIGSGSYPTLAAAATGETNSAYGTFRLLYTNNAYYTTDFNGPVPATIAGGQVTFAQAPLAVAPSTYNQSEAVNQVRVAYANLPSRTVSLWCASCHQAMHTNSGRIVHPVDAALNTGGEDGYYNRYVNSGSQNGSAATAFLSLVPFGSDGASRASLAGLASNQNSAASQAGPATTDTVMCLSCHRAHASGFTAATRWSNDNEFLTGRDTAGNPTWPGSDVGSAGTLALGKTAAETQASYYDRPVSQFGAYQRSLCNKCHAQD